MIYMATKDPKVPKSLGRQLNFTTGRLNALCEKILAPHDLTLSQWVVLSSLWREGPLTISALSTLIGTGMPATSRLVDRMVERGLVTRHRHENDARVAVVDVTSAGRGLDHLATFYAEINAILMDGFSDRERQQAFDLLARMEANVNRALH